MNGNGVYIVENGIQLQGIPAGGPADINTIGKIEYNGTNVKYYLNSNLLYTSIQTQTNPLYAYVAFESTGCKFRNLVTSEPIYTTFTQLQPTTQLQTRTMQLQPIQQAPPSRITDGQYYARPEVICYTGTPSYLDIDLGSSVDVAAVHIYNKSDNPDTYQSAVSIALLTEETLYAAGPVAVGTDSNKYVIDFGYAGSDTQCPIQLKWSSSLYGDSGLICQYIRINGCQGIKRLEVIDIMGIDVGLFKTIIDSNGTNAGNITIDGNTTQYNGTWLLLDLGEKKEICAVRTDIYLNATIQFSNDYITPIYSAGFYGEIDTRVDPENSKMSKFVTQRVTKYGQFGVYAQVIECPGTFLIVDATGKGFGPFTTSQNMGRLYEITAVNTSQSGVEIKLYDCNNNLVMYYIHICVVCIIVCVYIYINCHCAVM
jgi:hypothetical protein